MSSPSPSESKEGHGGGRGLCPFLSLPSLNAVAKLGQHDSKVDLDFQGVGVQSHSVKPVSPCHVARTL